MTQRPNRYELDLNPGRGPVFPGGHLSHPQPPPAKCPILRWLVGCLAVVSMLPLSPAATVTGRIRDRDSSSYLLGATVALRELDRAAISSAGGEFTVTNVPPGTYTLTVSSLGYGEFSRQVVVSESGLPDLDVALASDVLKLSKFVVEGTREGQARALQQKRTAESIMDVVSSDAVGKFPDGNAAEALRRVPGVSVEYDQDEGRYIVLRGLDSSLNSVTLNNQLIGTPSEQGNRGIALDSIPADLIARLEVVKAVTPAMDANAVGGSVNIVTQSAFDRVDPFLLGTVSGFYDNFSGRTTGAGSLSLGRTFGADKQWGIVGGFSYSLKDFSSQTVNTRSWQQVNGFWLPITEQSYDYDIKRERLGANVALQFRPAVGHELALRVNHNEFSDTEARQSVLYEYRMGTLTNQTPTSGANSTGRASRQFRDYDQTGTIDAASLEGRHAVGAATTLSWQAGYSLGERDVPTRVDWEYRSATTAALGNTYDLSGDVLVVKPTSNAYYEPVTYPFRRVRFRSDLEEEKVYSGQLDLKHEARLADRSTTWKFGAKYVSREKKDDRSNQNYNLAAGAANLFTLAQPGLAGPEPEGYFDGLFRFGPTLNLEANKAFFAANPNRFAYDPVSSLSDSVSGDFEAGEDVYAGYGMATVQLNKEWTVLAGLRYEATETSSGANLISRPGGTFRGDYKWVTASSDYDHVLPSLHLTWRPNNKVVTRFAWTNTIGRPNYVDLAPRSTLDSVETAPGSGVYDGSLSTGNPNLKPFESMNFDLSVEFYLKNSGIFSVGAFHKEIDNPIYNRSVFQQNVTVDGIRFNNLTVNAPDNAKSGRITGLEANYQQFFKFLPSPFDGFGVNLNYTVIDSEATLFTRQDKLPFFKQSDSVANFALFYEKYNWEVRVAVSFSDDFLNDVGGNTATDIYVRGRSPIDAKVSYRFNRHFKVFGEFLNLSEEPLREYTGERQRENDFEIYQWKARFGVSFNL